MANEIQNVAVAGASGNLGKEVVLALLEAGFNVTALTREDSTSTFPSNVVSKKVDYQSTESLISALQGQDAVVSTIATAAIGGQTRLVDAAVAVKVKRFIPSEFGVNTRILQGTPIGSILQGKVKTLDYIIEKSEENPDFTWTGISSGIFFDWGLGNGFAGFDKAAKTAVVYDSGDELFQASNLAFIGRAVVAVLTRLDETANRYLSVASFNPSQKQILRIIEAETGEKWKVEHANSADQEKIGLEKLSKGDYSAFSNLLRKHVYADGAGRAVKGEASANPVLALREDDLVATIKEWLRG
ncbi:NAD(P)-binding protein [Hypoxylon sp. NC1633]|nr:NAD(P)-binding protein [Hypoxylon sp. NC1633]